MTDKSISTPIKTKKAGCYYKYNTHVKPRLDEVYQWAKTGYTDYSIAESLGISADSLIQYKKDNIELSEVYARARKERSNLVMNKMLERASGTVTTVINEKLSKDGDIIPLKSEIFTPADPNAADLYLRNNDPEYKSARAAELQGNTTINILSVGEQRRLIAEVLGRSLDTGDPAIDAEYKVLPQSPDDSDPGDI